MQSALVGNFSAAVCPAVPVSWQIQFPEISRQESVAETGTRQLLQTAREHARV